MIEAKMNVDKKILSKTHITKKKANNDIKEFQRNWENISKFNKTSGVSRLHKWKRWYKRELNFNRM